MIRVLIIEDEELAAKRIKRLLNQLSFEIKVIDTIGSVVESVKFLSNQSDKVDLIFMDIHLGDGISFEIFDQISIHKPIIFITAYDQYALQAFKQVSIDYLLKPIQQDDLQIALDKYSSIFDKQMATTKNYDRLLEVINQSEKIHKKRFLVNVGDKIRYINVEDIAMFYADNKACFVISQEGKRYYINYTLEKLLPILDEALFHRVNRKVILNINSIIEMIPYSKSKLLIKTQQDPGFEVFVTAEKIKKLKDWLNA